MKLNGSLHDKRSDGWLHDKTASSVGRLGPTWDVLTGSERKKKELGIKKEPYR